MRNMRPNPDGGLPPSSLGIILQWWAFEVKEAYEYSFGRGPDDHEARYWDQWRRNNLHSKATRYALVHWLMTWLRNPSNENELRAMIKAQLSNRNEASAQAGQRHSWSRRRGLLGPRSAQSCSSGIGRCREAWKPGRPYICVAL
jgi:hypothetical protein